MDNNTKSIVLGGGCFWCLEAFLQLLNGVIDVTPGYAGGTTVDPTYEQVCYGIGNHAEVVQVVYDPSIMPLSALLEVFWSIHDPTTLNAQGHDVGPQYRSAIYYSVDEELSAINTARAKAATYWSNPIVTEIKKLDVFYKAENYHKNYFQNIPDKAYCQVVINPKLEKVQQKFANMLK